MSLTGNLEDLPLLDILQIVSFSKKTGILTIQAPEGQGAIVFHAGLVVSAFTWESLPVDARIVTLPPDRRNAHLKTRSILALERLTRLREGQFTFALVESLPRTVGTRDISLELLPMGINPQEMLLDLARGLDEDRRDSTAALEASFADVPAEVLAAPIDPATDAVEEPTPDEAADAVVASSVQGVSESDVEQPPAPAGLEDTPAASAARAYVHEPAPEAAAVPVAPQAEPASRPSPPRVAPPPRTVLLVDDEEDVRAIIGGLFRVVGYDVVEAEDPDAAVKAAHKLGKGGVAFLLLVDLGMPASGGSSFHGGFEVVKRLSKMHLHPPVLMMTESLNPGLRARARQMGISSFVFKPGLSKLDRKQFEADLRAFATRLVQDILPAMGREEAARRSGEGRPGGALAPPSAAAPDLFREVGLLQERLAELRRQSDPTQIALMVMRVAREFFERGVLLLVKNEELRGLGGFGLAPKDQKIGLLVREIVIPLQDESIFQEVVVGQKAFLGPLGEGRWAKTFLARLGRFKAGSAALLPLLTNRETVALLYGDNPETGVVPVRLDTLELFINQAGIALENAFLQRKVRGAGAA